MGQMRDEADDVLFVYQRSLGERTYYGRVGYSSSEARHAFAALEKDRGDPSYHRAWVGEVFFDHINGVRDPDPEPTQWPFLLVYNWEYFDWNATGADYVEEFSSAAEVIERGEAMVAEERRHGNGVSELWEVYCVRVTAAFDHRTA